jgi:predicted O-methyltransferase YrrM
MTLPALALIAAGCAALLVLRADLRRRRLSLTLASGWHVFNALDVFCPAALAGLIAALSVALFPTVLARAGVPLGLPLTWNIIAGIVIIYFTWQEGRRQVQFQRPAGIVFAETLILVGAFQLMDSLMFHRSPWPGISGIVPAMGLSVAVMVAGIAVLAIVVPPMIKRYEGHRVLEHLNEQGESVQVEYTPPTPECPHPERWKMVDSVSTELEIIDLLKALVVALKPELVLETGTFLGYSTIKMAEGLRENGFGKIITIEYDPAIFAKAQERIRASGLAPWIDSRNASSLESKIDGAIDLYFSDSKLAIREEEIRRFLPQVDPRGIILIHDASSHFESVREAALRMEKEGLLSVVLLSTPRGLVIAQKRAGRV